MPAQEPKAGRPVARCAQKGLEQPELAGQLDHRGRLAAGQHDAVDGVQFRRPADRAGVCAD